MKKSLLSLVALGSLIAAPAMAADLRMPVKAPPVPVAPVYGWTGFYIGANGGIGAGEFEYPFSLTGLGGGDVKSHSSGGFGGGQIGYNLQMAPAWVIGIEADLQGADIEDTLTTTLTGPGATTSLSAGSKLDWFGTVRGRAGYLINPSTLLYATGGWAYGHTASSMTVSATGVTPVSLSASHDKSGYAVGGGVETALNPWLSFKAEYLWLDLGSDTISTGTLGSISEKTTAHTIKGGFNIKLGNLFGAGPRY